MSSRDAIKVEGKVVDSLSGNVYWVELPNGHRVLAHPPKRKRGAAPLAVGQSVLLEMSPFDFSKGRICFNEEKL